MRFILTAMYFDEYFSWGGEKNKSLDFASGVEWVHCLFLFPLVLGKM